MTEAVALLIFAAIVAGCGFALGYRSGRADEREEWLDYQGDV
jgi:hypothetical protein